MRVHVCEHCPEGGHQQWVLELSAFMWKVLLSPLISVAGLPFHSGGGGSLFLLSLSSLTRTVTLLKRRSSVNCTFS